MDNIAYIQMKIVTSPRFLYNVRKKLLIMKSQLRETKRKCMQINLHAKGCYFANRQVKPLKYKQKSTIKYGCLAACSYIS